MGEEAPLEIDFTNIPRGWRESRKENLTSVLNPADSAALGRWAGSSCCCYICLVGDYEHGTEFIGWSDVIASYHRSIDWCIRAPDSSGYGWRANIPAESFGKQAIVLPNDASNLFDTSQGSVLRPRDVGRICSVSMMCDKLFALGSIS